MCAGQEVDFNAVFPRGRVQSPKVRAFVDFLVERLNFDADYMHMLCPDRNPRTAAGAAAAKLSAQHAQAAARLAAGMSAQTAESIAQEETA